MILPLYPCRPLRWRNRVQLPESESCSVSFFLSRLFRTLWRRWNFCTFWRLGWKPLYQKMPSVQKSKKRTNPVTPEKYNPPPFFWGCTRYQNKTKTNFLFTSIECFKDFFLSSFLYKTLKRGCIHYKNKTKTNFFCTSFECFKTLFSIFFSLENVKTGLYTL